MDCPGFFIQEPHHEVRSRGIAAPTLRPVTGMIVSIVVLPTAHMRAKPGTLARRAYTGTVRISFPHKISKFLSALAVMGLGFFFLNLAFALDYLFQNLIRLLIMPVVRAEPFNTSWFPLAANAAYVGLVILFTRRLLRGNAPMVIKAAWFTVPLAIAYVAAGILTYPYPLLAYGAGLIIAVVSFAVIRKYHASWHYYFAWGYVSLLMLIGALTGAEI